MHRACAVLFAITLIACGSSESHAAFAAEYRMASATYEEGLEELGARQAAEPQADRDTLLAMYTDFGDVASDVRDGLAALEPPPDLQPAVDRLITNLDRQVATVGRVVEAAEEDDAEALAVQLEGLAALVNDWALTDQLIVEQLPD